MNLTTATKPRKETQQRTRLKPMKPARHAVKGGKKIVKQPEFRELKEPVEVWIVETTYDGKTERHEFSNEVDANQFYGGFK